MPAGSAVELATISLPLASSASAAAIWSAGREGEELCDGTTAEDQGRAERFGMAHAKDLVG